jgi:tripartite-type tricarboxylate transporter receptor subunit TctC
MRLPGSALNAFPVALMLLAATTALGQEFPSKVIRIITSEPASTTDIVARIVAKGLNSSLGQPVIVENRGSMGADIVAKAAPDGHTLLFYGSSVWVQPILRKMPYDAEKDLVAISTGMRQAIVLLVHPSLPVKSVKELISLAKARPGQLNYSAGTTGATPHLAMELFKHQAGVDILRINYKGTGPAVNGLLGGETQIMFTGAGSVMSSHVKSGRLRALAVTTSKPNPLTPGLPTVASGLPGYEFLSVTGFFSPTKTPVSIVNILSREIVRILTDPKINEMLFESGVLAIGSSPEEFAAIVNADIARWREMIKDAAISGE